MNRENFISAFIEQVENYKFVHLHKNKGTGETGKGWSGGVQLYSPNKSKPDPDGHIEWLRDILNRVAESENHEQKVQIANEILVWGGNENPG